MKQQKPHKDGRLAEMVYTQMLRLIIRGEYPKDCRLPTEADLGERFGVSRPIIREALQQLREQGYVQSKRGSGTVVVRGGKFVATSLPPVRTVADLLRCYEFRITIEAATVSLAAERHTDGDLYEIDQVLRKSEDLLMERMLNLLPDVNFSFHRAIAKSTQNPYYMVILESMPNFVGRNTLDFAGAGGLTPIERAEQVHLEHKSILTAIRLRDVERAKREMERHILAARDVVLGQQLISEVVPVFETGA